MLIGILQIPKIPISRSIPDTLPHVNITRRCLTNSMLARNACSFGYSNIIYLYNKCLQMDGIFFLIIIISRHNLTLHLPLGIHKTIFIVHLARFSVAVWGGDGKLLLFLCYYNTKTLWQRIRKRWSVKSSTEQYGQSPMRCEVQ